MTHLKIEQNTGVIEEVPSSVIKKLYDLAISGTLDVSSNLKGRLSTTATYENYAQYLTSTYSELYITANKYYVDCKDPEVERIFATNYGDGTGVTRQDLLNISGAVSFGVQGNTTITDLSVLEYCTNARAIGSKAFQGCTSLVTIKIPEGVTNLGYDAGGDHSFYGGLRGCTSLKNVTLPSTLTSIYDRAFQECTALEQITIPANIQSFGHGVFYNCSALKTVNFSGSSQIRLGSGMFQGCSRLESIPFDRIVEIHTSTFENTGGSTANGYGDVVLNLDQVHCNGNSAMGQGFAASTVTINSSNLLDFGINQTGDWNWGGFWFYNNTRITKIDLSGCTVLRQPGEYGLVRSADNLETLKLPASVTTLPLYICAQCNKLKYVVLLATTPPTLTGPQTQLLYQSANANIYVPDAALSTYQTTWSDISTRIKAISELPSGI